MSCLKKNPWSSRPCNETTVYGPKRTTILLITCMTLEHFLFLNCKFKQNDNYGHCKFIQILSHYLLF